MLQFTLSLIFHSGRNLHRNPMEIPYTAANILGQRKQENSITRGEKPTYTTTKKVLKTTTKKVLKPTSALGKGASCQDHSSQVIKYSL